MFDIVNDDHQNAVIKVIGVGGGGGNAVQHMIDSQLEDVEFIVANTDSQALQRVPASTTIQLGGDITKGLGAGANPDVGRQSAMEDRENIARALEGADMLFITAGMGGGTGTGASPVVAEIARELGILTVAVVTKPFPFEGRKRMQVAMQGIKELREQVDSLITIPNEKLLGVLGRQTTLLDAFKAANNVLLGATQGIADLIIRPGLINVDFADVRTVMSEMGMAMMGQGTGKGENRAVEATETAIRSPLLEDVNLRGARGILVNITAGIDLTMGEFGEVGEMIQELAAEDATVVVGTAMEPEMSDEVRVTVVATGLGSVAPVQEPTVAETARPASPQRSVDYDRPPYTRAKSTSPASEANAVGAAAAPKSPTSMAADKPRESSRSSSSASVQQGSAAVAQEPAVAAESDEDNYLDIPAFLRRQAD
ncbi:cell division protein FtsZ [Umboniibacter marinipuniceus]|uniref:Cell division protein FtsZ n=1 Tax=Umboniibacter marinipuniceus TaxID=569599 RepID=A0A3M0AR06_9GAMM|nr:cell division protein FtsZ [Umboniibacter marinipuniceus]RMA81432.1 cell division protein FtsZ [Umboniibacter marinipuniceus]